ncbi:DUF4188 domain-containing protein [Halobacillus sp. SY10]|uniref:DUF4188 domain-containing protein n=1 Tax=Halobacillus aidingensis TaxID=240303 RepID=A0A1H0GA12_HALAD|nr:DUF4188 domain-containing protein [Halobacillus aidingensis]SDO03700.1 protein of unknown function [Halobacillus aidingensis]
MAAKIFPGRYTAKADDEVIVFLIGMRINKWLAVHKWLPVLLAMPPMVQELYSQKDNGFFSLENFINFRTTLMIQYWRSENELYAYARAPKHLKAWRNFNRKVKDNPAVGIFHETYKVKDGAHEVIYGNMPLFGLAKAYQHVPVLPNTASAKQRLRKKEREPFANSRS